MSSSKVFVAKSLRKAVAFGPVYDGDSKRLTGWEPHQVREGHPHTEATRRKISETKRRQSAERRNRVS